MSYIFRIQPAGRMSNYLNFGLAKDFFIINRENDLSFLIPSPLPYLTKLIGKDYNVSEYFYFFKQHIYQLKIMLRNNRELWTINVSVLGISKSFLNFISCVY